MNISTITEFLDPSHERYATGTPEDRERARREWRQNRFTAQVMSSGMNEIPRSDIAALRFGVVEDTRTGTFYRVRRDGLIDLEWTNANAYFVDAAGAPVLLEQPPGPKNRAELEQREAEREARRSAPKPRRTRVNR